MVEEASETLFQFVCRHAEPVKAREADLGAYPGDGLTAEQASALVENLRPISDAPEYLPGVEAGLCRCFKNRAIARTS